MIKIKHLLYLVGLFLTVLIFSGCNSESEEAYNSAIQNGLDMLGSQEYLKAEAYFEIAIEKKPDSPEAKALLSQTTSFIEALQLFENENYEEAAIRSEEILNIENGSTALITRAEKLITDIQLQLNKQKEITESEDHNSSLAEEENSSENPTNESDERNTEQTKKGINQEDILGIYALFESTPYASPIQLVEIYTDRYYISGLKESSYSTGNILDVKVMDNVFLLEYHIPETPLEEGGDGEIQVELIENNGEKYLYYPKPDLNLYPISEQDLLDEGWSLPGVLADSEGEESGSETKQNAEYSDNPSEIIDTYNNLPLPLKVILAATTVDERAMTPELLGYYLNYNFDENRLLVNVHSGAGTGHPWYTLKYDNDTITPVGGIVSVGMDGYQDAHVDPTPVSKIDLYKRYMASKESYDIAVENTFESEEMNKSEFEQIRSEID